MDKPVRKPLQGVLNIVRFNYHFYLLAFSIILFTLLISKEVDETMSFLLKIPAITASLLIICSLLVSSYIYDFSGLYRMKELRKIIPDDAVVINLHSGFDETSGLLKQYKPSITLLIGDFYNPLAHNEISIRRARKRYPSYPGTSVIKTDSLPYADGLADYVLVLLAAHEIRNENERIIFFNELKRVIKPDGKIIVQEHLRDLPNLLAFSFGVFHFFSRTSWLHVFKKSELTLLSEFKITPFISTFILNKNGTTS